MLLIQRKNPRLKRSLKMRKSLNILNIIMRSSVIIMANTILTKNPWKKSLKTRNQRTRSQKKINLKRKNLKKTQRIRNQLELKTPNTLIMTFTILRNILFLMAKRLV